MNQLGLTWLEPGEKIEAIRNQKLLRLITTKTKAEIILKNIHETLARVTMKTVPLNIISSNPVDDALLEEVGRITNTHIRRSHNDKRVSSPQDTTSTSFHSDMLNHSILQLHVTWIETRRDSRGLEDLRHVVFRLLWTALAPERASTALYAEISSNQTGAQFVADKTNREKWGWKDKMEEWARYVLPLPTPEIEASGQDANSNVKPGEVDGPLQNLPLPMLSSFPSLAKSRGLPLGDLSPIANRVRWARESKTTTKAHFGHLLHSYQPTAPPPQDIPELLASHHPRIFSPTTPHPLHLAKLDSTAGDNPELPSHIGQTKSTVVIRFWPSPSTKPGEEAWLPKLANPPPGKHASRQNGPPRWTNHWNKWTDDDEDVSTSTSTGNDNDETSTKKYNDETSAPPVLELRLAATDTEILGVESLQAIVDCQVSDVMLPSSPVDMRVTQTRRVDLIPLINALESTPADNNNNSSDVLANWKPISDFLSNARLDLAAGKLEMPPRQRFPIPRRLFSRRRDSLLLAKEESSKESSGGENPLAEFLDYEKEEKDLLSATYEFVGLELHRSTSIPYDDVGRGYGHGHTLTYTSIEAGQGGGRRAEVTLEPVLPSSGRSGEKLNNNKPDDNVEVDARESQEESQEEEELQKDFLACCYRFAKSDLLWSGYLMNRQRKP